MTKSNQTKQIKYEVLIFGKWIRCSIAREERLGWLSYQLRNGEHGLVRPEKWRVVKS